MPNTIISPTWVMKDVARYWTNEVRFVANCNRTYDDQYMVAGAKIGNTVKVRIPQKFQASDGAALQVQAIYNETADLTLTNQKHVGFSWSTWEGSTEIQSARANLVQPAAEVLANAADVLAINSVYRDVFLAVGSPGAGAPSTTSTYLAAGTKLTYSGTMRNGRVAVLDPDQMQVIAQATQTLFNPTAGISENFKNGKIGMGQLAIGEWFEDPNMVVHTTGTFTASTPLVNGASQTGATLATDGWASGASSLKQGDIFTIANVYSVNPISHQSTGQLQQFVVTADTSDSGGAMATLPISPSIITSGALQTVTASPANNAVITVLGATSPSAGTLATTNTKQGVVFHPDAFAFAMADLEKPNGGAEVAAVRSKQWGLSMRMVQQYQIGTDQNATRIDFLAGAATIFPDRAVRVYS